MTAHPIELEPDRSLVYAEAGQADRPDGVLLKAGDHHDRPLELLESPLAMDLFHERQADYELELGEGYRVEARHGEVSGGPSHLPRPLPPRPEDVRAGARKRVERILEDLNRA